jgi:hypothetical protein
MAGRSLRRLMLICVALVALASISRGSAADPPDPKSGDGQLMAPYRDAVRTLSQRNGAPCCSESDCRPAALDASAMPLSNASNLTDVWRHHRTLGLLFNGRREPVP